MEYEIVYAHLELVLKRTVAHQEANQQMVTLSRVLQREQGVLSIKHAWGIFRSKQSTSQQAARK